MTINPLGAIKMAEQKMKEEYKKTFEYKYSDYILDDKLVMLSILNEKKDYYDVVIKILEDEFSLNHKKGGRKPKLSIEDKLSATISFYSSNITYLDLSKKYGIHESNMYDSIDWVVNTLVNKKIAKVIKDNNRYAIELYYKNIDKILEKK